MHAKLEVGPLKLREELQMLGEVTFLGVITDLIDLEFTTRQDNR